MGGLQHAVSQHLTPQRAAEHLQGMSLDSSTPFPKDKNGLAFYLTRNRLEESWETEQTENQ